MSDRAPWHDEYGSDAEVARKLGQTIDMLWSEQAPMRDRWLRLFGFYYGEVLSSWEQLRLPTESYDEWTDDIGATDVMAWNVTRSIVDAFVSRVGVNTPEPRWLTSEATIEKQEQARLREQFTLATMNHLRTHDLAKTALWSSAICGAGAVKTYERDGDVRQRYLRPDTVLMDTYDDDGRCIYHRESVPRSTLMALAKDDAQRREIELAPTYGMDGIPQGRDHVMVVEAWCKALGSSKGRHVLMLQSAGPCVPLVVEDWDDEEFPVRVLTFARFASGHHGDSLAKIVNGCARMINRLLWKAVLNHEHLAVPMLVAPSSLRDLLKDNRQLRYLPSDEGVPQIISPNAIPPETLQLIDMNWNKAYEISGMSMYAAQGTRPPGLSSGRAIIEHNELQTLRFSDPESKFEDFQAIELGDAIIRCGKRIAESEDGWLVEVEDDSVVNKIDWSDLDTEGNWRLTRWPASQLGSTPSGKQEKIAGIAQLGAIDRDEIRQLLRLSDMDRGLQLSTSPITMYRKIFEAIVSGKAFVRPTQHDVADLPKAMMLAREYRALAAINKNESAVDGLETWMDMAAALAEPPAQEPQISGSLPATPEAAAALAGAQQTLEGVQ